jgi:hypothetical protein
LYIEILYIEGQREAGDMADKKAGFPETLIRSFRQAVKCRTGCEEQQKRTDDIIYIQRG